MCADLLKDVGSPQRHTNPMEAGREIPSQSHVDSANEPSLHEGRSTGASGEQPNSGTGMTAPSDRGSQAKSASDEAESLHVGDRVEAKFKGGSKWFSGKIVSVNRDGSYDVRYDDGDEERRVPRDSIRPMTAPSDRGSGSSDLPSHGFSMGDMVEAKFKGGRIWFRGRILGANADGTFHVRYDDGDEEKNVPLDRVRKLSQEDADRDNGYKERQIPHGNTRAELSRSYALSDYVEARYFQSEFKWVPAVVVAENENGTYDVMYANGEIECDLNSSSLRAR